MFVASSYIDLLEVTSLPDVLVQTMAWVVGEYAYLAVDYDQAVSQEYQSVPGFPSLSIFVDLPQSSSVLASVTPFGTTLRWYLS